MKLRSYIAILTQVIFTQLIGQDKGLYLSAQDFDNGKLTYSSKSTRIHSHELFHKNTVEVNYNDSVFVYEKKNVFGYADNAGVYRFVGNAKLLVLNPTEQILIYRKTTGTGMKNSPVIDTYYFSKNAGSEVLPLTLNNLLAAFANNSAYTQLLELCFTTGSGLLDYDAIHRQYRINRLLELSTLYK